MGLGQTMITSAFLVLLTIAVMNANKMVLDQDYNYYQHKAFEQSSILATALLDEISKKKFDSSVDTASVGYYPSSYFDGPGSMGPSSTAANYVNPYGRPDSSYLSAYKSIRGDNGNYFDDIDDYKGYYRLVNTSDISGFNLTVNVYYVSQSNPDLAVWYRTYLKKVDVLVTQYPYLQNGLTYSRVIAY